MRVNTDQILCWGVEVGVGSALVRPISVIRGSPTGVWTSSTRRRKLAVALGVGCQGVGDVNGEGSWKSGTRNLTPSSPSACHPQGPSAAVDDGPHFFARAGVAETGGEGRCEGARALCVELGAGLLLEFVQREAG